jgi:hypothetical protein
VDPFGTLQLNHASLKDGNAIFRTNKAITGIDIAASENHITTSRKDSVEFGKGSAEFRNNSASLGNDSVNFGKDSAKFRNDSAASGNDSAPVHCHSLARFYWYFNKINFLPL